jgi:hypothetical protein
MYTHNIVNEEDALEQLREDAQRSMCSTVKLLEWIDIKEQEWVDDFVKLSNEAKNSEMNHYKINYLIGLSILIPVLPKFRAELRSQQTVLINYKMSKLRD